MLPKENLNSDTNVESAPTIMVRGRVDLVNGPVDSSLRRFAIPMAFSFLVNMLYTLIDRFYVSRLGDTSLAAIGAADQVGFLIFTIFSGIGVGTGIVVSRRMGEGNSQAAGRTALQGIVAMMLVGISLSITLLFLLPYTRYVTPLPAEVTAETIRFLSTYVLGLTGTLVTFQIGAIVRSTGNSVFSMVILIFTTILNAVIAPLLIFGLWIFPDMGIAGAGLATAIAQTSGAIIALWAVTTGKAGLSMSFRGFQFDLEIIRSIVRLGLPASLQMFSVSINRLFLFLLVGTYGTQVIAAYTLGISVDIMVFMSVFAVGASVEVATGQNLGAGNPGRVFSFYYSGVRQLSILLLALGSLVYLFGGDFAAFFTSDPVTLVHARTYFHITVFGYVFAAIGVVSVRVLSGAGAARTSLFIVLTCMLLFQFPVAWLLSRLTPLNELGVWYAVVLGQILLAVVSVVVVHRKRWIAISV